jgi:hypothetical protein
MTIIEKTPFIFEDGESYYFDVHTREYSTMYHDLYVYKKHVKTILWFTKEYFTQVGEPCLIETDIVKANIKKRIRETILSTKAYSTIPNWDGFVGNIPDDVKKSLIRDNKLKNILGS